MIPAPGFQKPIPYLLDTEAKKSNTSLLTLLARFKSKLAPCFAWIKWSQCTVVGTATLLLPACINCNKAICAVASWQAIRSGAKST